MLRTSYEAQTRRVAAQRAARPHAGELLGFFGVLLREQESVALEVSEGFGPVHRLSPPDYDGPDAMWHNLPLGDLGEPFDRFIAALVADATSTLCHVAGMVRGAAKEVEERLLRQVVKRSGVDDIADQLGCETAPLEFFPRAFLQPVVGSLTAEVSAASEAVDAACPVCGWPPQAAAMVDEPETKGRRYLVCSMCGAWWPFARSQCPACRETDSSKLEYHVPESTPYVRVEECAACSTYIKSVDLRTDGRSDPLVDDVATVELDLWSQERGLRKIQPNVLGF